jgi:hypothetical protein
MLSAFDQTAFTVFAGLVLRMGLWLIDDCDKSVVCCSLLLLFIGQFNLRLRLRIKNETKFKITGETKNC